MIKIAQYLTIAAGLVAFGTAPGKVLADASNPAPVDDITVTVTANRVPTPLDQVSSSVTIITAQEMEEAHDTFVIDALRDVPGLFVTQTGGPGGLAEVQMRGEGVDTVLVELDGVPLNDPISPQGSFDQLGNLTVDNIERIEILRGPQSMLYGSKAIAGVISIITKRGRGKPSAKLTFEGGSYRTAEGAVSSLGSVGGWRYSASGSRTYTGGISFNDLSTTPRMDNPYGNTSFSGRLDRDVSPDLSLNVIGRYMHATSMVAGFNDPANFNLATDSTSTERSEEKTWRLGADWHPQKGRLSSALNFSSNAIEYAYDFQTPPTSPTDIEPYNGLSYQIDWQASYVADKANSLTAGFQRLTDEGRFTSPYDSLSDRTLLTTGVFAQDQITLTSRWHATLGLRNDNHETFGDKTTYRAGTTYQLNGAGTLLRATYGTGFKAPVLYELYDPLYGNANLKPELSESWEGGIEQPVLGGRGAVTATYFHNDYSDLIDFVVTNPVTFQGAYNNVAGALTQGLELAVALKPTRAWRIKLSYTNLYAVDQNGNSLNRRPRNVTTFSTTYQACPKLELNVNGTAVSDRIDQAAFPPVKLSPYLLVNAAATYKLSVKDSAFMRIDNLLDEHYEEVYSYRTPGIGLYVGISIGL